MKPIRVLVVDDSAVARGLITSALAAHPDIQVAGSVASGAIALSRLAEFAPDAVILDIEMPEMDGITTLRHIRARDANLPVVMFSALSESGARVTFDALAAGASDYALKPSSRGGETIQSVARDVLVPKLIALVRAATPGLPPRRPSAPSPTPTPAVSRGMASPAIVPGKIRLPPRILAIASSTGGPNALAEVIPLLSADTSVPVVIVQHMPPIFTRCLAERLASRSSLRVLESAGDELLRAGSVYIAPGDFHMELVRDADGVRTKLTSGPPENSCRPAADVLFRSVARVYGPNALCVVLTGMGSDGMLGAREVVQAGGRVIAQSGPSCVVWGMPKAVEEAGLCEAVVPLSEMALAINQRIANAPSSAAPARAGG